MKNALLPQLIVSFLALSTLAQAGVTATQMSRVAPPTAAVPSVQPETPQTFVLHASQAAPARMTASTEDWKGAARSAKFSLGGLTGIGVAGGYTGYTLLGTLSKTVAQDGWLDDINDQLSLEAYAGPMFTSGSSLFKYSLHLRWDFQKDDALTLYALGGIGGDITGGGLGSHFYLYPRFALGALWDIKAPLLLRAELSHELIALGVSLPL